MRRGEIWTASGGGDYAGKPRPVLIVQDDAFVETASVVVCLLTSHTLDAPLLRIRIEPSAENGLRETSFAMADKITTIPRARLGRRVGAVAPAAVAEISRAIIVFLGLAGPVRG